MALTISAETVPLTADPDGVVRVGATRVTLDTVVLAFHEGATPEEIAYQYPTLKLADIYAALAYYLRRRAEVDAYLRHRRQQGEQARRRNESECDPAGVRDRLLARRPKGIARP